MPPATRFVFCGRRQDAAAVHAAEAALQQTEARQRAVEAEAGRASDDAVRYRTLHEKDEVSRQLLDRAETEARSATANLEAARQAVGRPGRNR
jgi:multidrug resistance efflux pump